MARTGKPCHTCRVLVGIALDASNQQFRAISRSLEHAAMTCQDCVASMLAVSNPWKRTFKGRFEKAF